MRVLVMESEQSIEEPIRLQLNAMGYQNEVAEDGVTGLEKAVRDIYDLAIVDEELPQMSPRQRRPPCRRADPDAHGRQLRQGERTD